MKRIAVLVFLSLAACATTTGPGPECAKLFEMIRARCEVSEFDEERRQWCAQVAESAATPRQQDEWEAAEAECDSTNRALERGVGISPNKDIKDAPTYKFVGALEGLVDETDAETADP